MNESGQRIGFVEVSPRDGLQNESAGISTIDKVELVARAVRAGAKRIEVTSFVNPHKVPQMADAEAVAAALPLMPGVTYIGLVLNQRGALRALETPLHEIGAVCAASDSFGRRNQGQTWRESLDATVEVVKLARRHGRSAQATIAVAFGCPFEGWIEPARIVVMARELAASGVHEVGLADTVGVGAPGPVAALVAEVCAAVHPLPVRAHFHNTRNTGMANVWAAIGAGAKVIDASIGGIGGCPFAPRASGNVPSEDVAYMLHHSGIDTGLDLAQLVETAEWLGSVMGKTLPGMLGRAGPLPANIPRR